MYCSSCGAEQYLELSYCSRCGASLNQLKSAGKTKPLNEAIDSALWSIAGITLAMLGMMVAVMALMIGAGFERRDRRLVHGGDDLNHAGAGWTVPMANSRAKRTLKNSLSIAPVSQEVMQHDVAGRTPQAQGESCGYGET